jgi:hypothetical protein
MDHEFEPLFSRSAKVMFSLRKPYPGESPLHPSLPAAEKSRACSGNFVRMARVRYTPTRQPADVLGFPVGFEYTTTVSHPTSTASARRIRRAISPHNQNFLNIRATWVTLIMNKGWPYSTAWPFSARIFVTVPTLLSVSLNLHRLMMHITSPSDHAADLDKRFGAPLDER